MKLTKQEKEAIQKLKEVADIWPNSLWLFSASGSLHVMKKKKGKRVMFYGAGVDPDYSVDTINIENDGGDW